MRTVTVEPPSFPSIDADAPFAWPPRTVWHVLCGDDAHYRIGVYSPALQRIDTGTEFEQHDCPEFFLLLNGALTLALVIDGAIREVPLALGRPIMVSAPHTGFCPMGPHTGTALVVERDRFATVYRTLSEWRAA